MENNSAENLINTLKWYQEFYQMEIPASLLTKALTKDPVVVQAVHNYKIIIISEESFLGNHLSLPEKELLQAIIEKGLNFTIKDVLLLDKNSFQEFKNYQNVPVLVFANLDSLLVNNLVKFISNNFSPKFNQEKITYNTWINFQQAKILFANSILEIKNNLEFKKAFWQQIKNLK